MYGKMLAAAPPPGPIAAAPPAPPVSAKSGGPPQAAMSSAASLMSAEAQHRKKADAFAHHAIIDFLTGKITRQHLADALADESGYDWPQWRAANVVHPSQAGTSAGELPEPKPGAAGP